MNKMEKWRDRLATTAFLIAVIALALVCFTLYQLYIRREAITFAVQNPDLVLNMKERLASESAQAKAKMMTVEKSSDDKLKDAITDSLKK